MYATFAFYVSEYYGNIIPEEDFDRFASKASDYIDYLTMGKAKAYDDTTGALAKACCAIADQYAVADSIAASVAGIASESVGSHSRSFRSGAEIKAERDSAILSAAQTYLLPTGLLYRGVPCIRRIP